ncbi:biopolymer transporter ExbD [Planctomycetota bacterium]|nr:biopolymer transporter ExbD [Planctomycetota bacterium]
MRTKKRRKQEDKASPDLTPMIDVTFQLLIFFILCTRFKVDERNYQVELPLTEGTRMDDPELPKDQATIYCVWDDHMNYYQVAIGARARKVVEGSHASLDDLVIRSSDPAGAVTAKKARYRATVLALGNRLENYIADSGANIQKVEIAYAKDNTVGVASGTTPWMFVSLAVDAAAHLNRNRANDDKLPVTFKFADAQQRYQR